MRRTAQRLLLLSLGTAAGIVIVVTAALLITDHVRAARQAPADKNRLETLRKLAREDVAHAPEVMAEYDRQTQESLRRAARQKVETRVLIAAAVLFLVWTKWLLSLRGQAASPFETVHAARQAVLGERARGESRPRPRARTGRSSETDADAPFDASFVDQLVAQHGRSAEAAVPILQAIQSHYRYLPDEALRRVCELTEISPAQIAGVSSFYAQFRRSPVGRHIVKVCHGTACHVAGAREITEELRRHLKIEPDADTDPQRLFTIDEVACLGCCSLAPVIMIDDETVGRLTPASASEAIDAFRGEGKP